MESYNSTSLIVSWTHESVDKKERKIIKYQILKIHKPGHLDMMCSLVVIIA